MSASISLPPTRPHSIVSCPAPASAPPANSLPLLRHCNPAKLLGRVIPRALLAGPTEKVGQLKPARYGPVRYGAPPYHLFGHNNFPQPFFGLQSSSDQYQTQHPYLMNKAWPPSATRQNSQGHTFVPERAAIVTAQLNLNSSWE